MKQLSILLLVLLIFSCTTPESKAKKLIKEDLFKTLEDYDSYQEVEFGYLYPCHRCDEIDIEKEKNEDSVAYKKRIAERDVDMQKYMDSLNRIMGDTTPYRQEVSEYELDYKFRAKNKMGGYVLATYRYYFDSSISKIIKQEKLNE